MRYVIKLSSVTHQNRTITFTTHVRAESEQKAVQLALTEWASYRPTLVSVQEDK